MTIPGKSLSRLCKNFCLIYSIYLEYLYSLVLTKLIKYIIMYKNYQGEAYVREFKG